MIASLSISSNLPFYKCSFSPIDASVAVCTGKDCVKFFRIAERDMRVVHENEIPNQNFISQCWLRHPDDTLIAGTESGDLLVFQNGEFVCTLSCLPKSESESKSEKGQISSLLAFNLGFIIGSSNGTFHFVYLNMDAVSKPLHEQFSLVKTVRTDLTGKPIISMSLSIDEDGFSALSADNQLLYINLLNPHTLEPEDIVFSQMSFHGPSAIQGMDVCLKKPLILTCSEDSTLRIWNFLTNELELHKNFAGDEMFCCALHPTGLHAAVGFSDKLRVYHVLVDDIRVCLEVPIKACKEARFSHGGHMLAAANGNSICVYEFCTGEKVVDLKGHNSKVKALYWLKSGFQLLSCGQDGAVYLWDLEGKRNGEFLNKGNMYTSVVNVDDRVFATGSDKKLLELDLSELIPVENRSVDLVMSHLAISASKGVILASTDEKEKPNSIRAYAYPVTGDYNSYPCVASVVTRMRLTPDEKFLVVADKSGCLVVLELKDRNDRFTRNPNAVGDITEGVNWTDEVLLTRADLEEKNATIGELKTKVEELKLHNEYQQKLKEMNYSENIKEVTDKFFQELEQSKSVYRLLQEEISDCELEYEEKRNRMNEEHQHDLQELETDYQAQIMEQVDLYHSIVRERDAHIERLDEQRKKLIEAHEQFVDSLIADFERKLEEDRAARLQLEDEKAELVKELEEGNRQLEDDIDTEIEETRKGYDEKLTVAKENTLKYKGENGMLKKKFTVMQGELDAQKEEELSLREREKELHEQIKVLEKEISVHKKEIKARDVKIGEKEKRIYELKKKNQELDKFKFVLDYKIRELKRQIEPRQQEIAGMKEQIRSMDEELEKYHKSNANLDGIIGTLRVRINETQDEIQEKRSQAKKLEQTIKGFKGDLQMCMTDILDPVKLLESVDKLVAKHGSTSTIKASIDPEVNDEYERHKEFLNKSVVQLKDALESEIQSHTDSTRKMMKANLDLIDEINKQREVNRDLKESVQASTGRLMHLARVQAEKIASATKKRESSGSQLLPPAPTSSMKKATRGTELNLRPRDVSMGPATDAVSADDINPLSILDKNRRRISALRLFISELEGRIVLQSNQSSSSSFAAGSREGVSVLPPIELGTAEVGGKAFSSEFNDSLDLKSPGPVIK